MNITDDERIKIRTALALMNSMILSGERHSEESQDKLYEALKILNHGKE